MPWPSRLFLFAFLMVSAFSLRAEVVDGHRDSLPVLSGDYRFSYEEIQLPDGERMGLLGGNYLLRNDHNVYLGLGIYGAVTGQRGGFFVGGFDTGAVVCRWQYWCVDAGAYVGGGGGAAAPQGGGLMLRPHLELRYLARDEGWQWGVGVSEVRFPNGNITDRQGYLSVARRFQTLMLPGWHESADLQKWSAPLAALEGSSRTIYLQLMNYYPTYSQRGRSGKVLDQAIQVGGVRWRQDWLDDWLLDFETAGAFGGEVDGLAQVFAGTSWRWCRLSYFDCYATAMIGSAGGGDLHTGGGVLGRVLLGSEYAINKHWSVLVEGGQTSALQAPFNASMLNVGLGYRYGVIQPTRRMVADDSRSTEWQRNRWRLGAQSYFSSVDQLRKSSQGSEQVDLLALKLDSFFSKTGYVTGQALGAFRGDAGGYAVGLMGIGGHWMLSDAWFAEAEVTTGAAGGGGIAVGSGAVLQPMLSLGWRFDPSLAVSFSAGQVWAIDGELSAQVADVSVNYHFSVPHWVQ
ncbi:MAG: hypothetical protein OEW58_03925 [Gammaproteobacteria bacterium]|nr:hypothetical protein [Gammaproteobacteria bacterium]